MPMLEASIDDIIVVSLSNLKCQQTRLLIYSRISDGDYPTCDVWNKVLLPPLSIEFFDQK